MPNGPVFKLWSENWTEKALILVKNVPSLNGQPSHVTLPFKYWTCSVRYSDESGIQVSGIQINLVFKVSGIQVVTVVERWP